MYDLKNIVIIIMEWVDCYNCGKAAPSISENYLAGNFYHQECLPQSVGIVPIPPRRELDEIRRDPMGWLHKEKRKKSKTLKYLITFTWNNSVEKSKWKKKVNSQLKRKWVKEILGIGLEHPEANIHVHAYVEANVNLRKQQFAAFEKSFGYVDIKKVNTDNGIGDYVGKENLIQLEDLII